MGTFLKVKGFASDNYVMATVTNCDCPSQTQMYGHPVWEVLRTCGTGGGVRQDRCKKEKVF